MFRRRYRSFRGRGRYGRRRGFAGRRSRIPRGRIRRIGYRM